MFRKCVLIVCFLAIRNSLFCITDTWTGAVDANWGTAGNWQAMMVPGTTAGGGDVAIMSGAANTTISLGANRILGEIDFNLAAGYTINAGGGLFTFQVSTGGSAQIVVNAGPNTITAPITITSPLLITQNATSPLVLSGTMTGTTTLTKQGTGTLTLSANNMATYTGQISIDQGTISIAADNNLGAPGIALTISNGILSYTMNDTNSRPFSLAGSAGVNVTGANLATLNGLISGPGSLTKGDSGTLTLGGGNSYQGGTIIAGGTLIITSDSNLGATTGPLTIGNGTLNIMGGISTSRSGSLSGNATITSGDTHTFSGNFSGPGNLTITGGGTFVFIGSNSYTGGTVVDALTRLSGTTNGAQGNITTNALSSHVAFNQNFDGTYSGALSGPGQLFKEGSGAVTFTGISSPGFTGPTTINQGLLIINGSIASSSLVTVSSGGGLGGSGTVGPTLSMGLIDPGSGTDVGTLTINGMLTMMGTSARTNINITPLSADRISVLGVAAITGPLQIIPTPGFYGFSADYTILTSTGLGGTFLPVTSTVPSFAPIVTYTATDALLHVVISEPFAIFPFSNANTAAVGNNIDELYAANQLSQDLFNVFNTFVGQSSEVINDALDQMHPAPYSALTELQAEVNGQLISLFHRLPYLPCSCNSPNRLWIEGFGNSLTLKQHGLEIGFQANSGGIAFGYDGQVGESLVLGLGGAWSRNLLDWHDSRGHGDVNGFYGSIYFDSQIDSFYFGGTFLAGMDFFDTSRNLKFLTTDRKATAEFQAFDMTGQIATAYLFGSPQAFFYPYANIDYLFLHTHKFSEKGASGLNLTVFDRTDGTLRTEMGLGLQVQDRNALETVCISPLVSIGWVNMCPIERPKLIATFQDGTIPFKVIGWNESWNLLNVNFGLSVAYHCFSFMLDYNVEISPDSDTLFYNQHGNLRLDWKW